MCCTVLYFLSTSTVSNWVCLTDLLADLSLFFVKKVCLYSNFEFQKGDLGSYWMFAADFAGGVALGVVARE